MKLRDEIAAIVSDFANRDEVDGLTNNLMYYFNQHQKGSFIGGLIVGFISGIILLKYLS